MAYFATGLALTGYDFSAPPLHKKGYVVSQNYRVAMMIWLAWPLTSLREVQVMSRFHPRSGLRLFIGVLLLAVGMYSWGRVAFTFTDGFIGVFWINAVATFVLLALFSPIMTFITMPKHS